MPTARVMTWNIEAFGKAEREQEEQRLRPILEVIRCFRPDFIVITEVMGRAPGPTDLVVPDKTVVAAATPQGRVACFGMEALQELQTALSRTVTPYCLVPPRFLSISEEFGHGVRSEHEVDARASMANEAIAVFFNPATFSFCGPHGNFLNFFRYVTLSFETPPKTAVLSNYPSLWKNSLPSSPTTPFGTKIAVPQDQLSGRLLKVSPRERQYDRSALYTVFQSVADTNAYLHIVSAHLPLSPHNGQWQGYDFVGDLCAAVNDLRDNVAKKAAAGSQNVFVVAGDFNASAGAFLQSSSPSDGSPAPGSGYQVALDIGTGTSTDIRQSTQLGNGRGPNVYPGYGWLQPLQSDNVIVHGATQPIVSRIANPVVGTLPVAGDVPCPFGYVDPAAEAPDSADVYVYPPQLCMRDPEHVGKNVVDAHLRAGALPTELRTYIDRLFRQAKFVSDHLPLIVDVPFGPES